NTATVVPRCKLAARGKRLKCGACRPCAARAAAASPSSIHPPNMSLNNVSPGSKLPETFNVVIEIPAEADPIKYEVDKESGAVFVDRFLTVAMYYPCNYGYVPQTLSGDGDPVDVLVITPYPLLPGVVVPC